MTAEEGEAEEAEEAEEAAAEETANATRRGGATMVGDAAAASRHSISETDTSGGSRGTMVDAVVAAVPWRQR